MIPKVLSTLCSRHISYLTNKHNLLPSTQFRGCPGHNTTDAMLLVVHKIKNAWRHGKVAAALFLDIQGAFPNTVKEQLIHNSGVMAWLRNGFQAKPSLFKPSCNI
jgi:hypothetical protein